MAKKITFEDVLAADYQEGTEARLEKLEHLVAEMRLEITHLLDIDIENRRRHSYLLKRLIRRHSA